MINPNIVQLLPPNFSLVQSLFTSRRVSDYLLQCRAINNYPNHYTALYAGCFRPSGFYMKLRGFHMASKGASRREILSKTPCRGSRNYVYLSPVTTSIDFLEISGYFLGWICAKIAPGKTGGSCKE